MSTESGIGRSVAIVVVVVESILHIAIPSLWPSSGDDDGESLFWIMPSTWISFKADLYQGVTLTVYGPLFQDNSGFFLRLIILTAMHSSRIRSWSGRLDEEYFMRRSSVLLIGTRQ